MSLSSIIGQASRGADLYFVFRFLRLLTMDYKKTDAYKFKIIDGKGNALKKSADLESTKEKAAYTMLHRMVFKIRRLIEKVPGGRFISYAAALFLLKEQKDVRIWTDDIYMKTKLLEFLETDWEADAKFLKEEVDNMDKKSFKSFLSENKTIEESQELQAMMALDDAGIEAVIDKKGKIVINKKDKKKAEKALKKSFKKGGIPEIQYEEVELSEEVADITIQKDVGKMGKNQVAAKVMTNARKLFGLKASVNGEYVRISGSKKKVNDYLDVIIGRSSSGDATQKGPSNPQIDKMLTKGLKEEVDEKIDMDKPGYFGSRHKKIEKDKYNKKRRGQGIKDEVEEARKAAKDIGLECQECGKRFRSKNPRYGVTKCPKCKSTDLDLAYGEEVEEAHKIECPKCKGEGCEHCDGKGYHIKEEVKEARSKEDELELAKAIAAWKKAGGKVKKLPPGRKFQSLFGKGYKPKKQPRQAEETEEEASTYRDREKDDEKKKKKHFAFGGKKKSRHGESGYGKGEEVEVDEA